MSDRQTADPTVARGDDGGTDPAQPPPSPAHRAWTALVPRGAAGKAQWTAWAQRYGAFAALVVLFVYNAVATPFFLTPQSLLFVLLRQAAPIAIVAVGMAIVIGTAGIDLSVGSVMAIAGQVGATLVLHDQPFLLAIVAALLVAALCGLFNGTLVARFGVQPIIATLVLMAAILGSAAGYWMYRQMPPPVISLTVEARTDGLFVVWPAEQTSGSSAAFIRVNDGPVTELPADAKTAGRWQVQPGGGNLKVELLAKHLLHDSRGIVRYIDPAYGR